MVTVKRSGPGPCWHVVVPIKDTRHGKSRLAPAGVQRTRLSRAIADDTLSAVVEAVEADHVWLVTSDAGLMRDWAAVGVQVVPDPGHGLNAAIAAGLGSLPVGSPRAALLGDLPSLTAVDLVTALQAGGPVSDWFVPDLDGSGTVLRGGHGFVPLFGPGSADAHAGQGALRLELDLPRLRRDVDDPASLAAAVQLGVGRATSAALGLTRAKSPVSTDR
jgi:2-phospho-L-lactate guanylyltransferase